MKKNNLRIIVLNMILVFTIALAGCGSSKDKKDDGATGLDAEIASSDVAQAESTDEATEKTEEETTEATEKETTEATTEKPESQSGGIDNNGESVEDIDTPSNNSNNSNNNNNSNSNNNNNGGGNSGNQAPSTTQATTETTTEATTQATTEATTEATTQATTEATTQVDVEEGYSVDYSQTVLSLVNEQRRAAGLSDLQLDYTLMTAAQTRAKECSISFSHTRPDGSSCFTAWNVSYWTCGENIAAGYWSAQSVVEGWMNSEGHRANILNPDFTHMAVGCYYDPNSVYGYYWAQCFVGR